ncbi:GspH/FimT family pseudopilin [Pseudomonas violetae]|jgi:type IV fimbrial biogenesis protein FimU|uniref:Type II secretion system protein H n=1 Tax=Pseudomonas violetae TaxID=2915813 RepID=A0ABT0F3E7_9PSED|nr:GspH/FimT family pseudopilin [Pseudomonas violetae]MCK1792525.1 GspH/FimT family pseudopilin [Pseudomonas violetae]
MDRGTKGFTLIELLIALAIFLILITLAVPAFTGSVQSTRADTEVGDLRRALNFARLEAIDRGITTQVLPKDGGAWTGTLTVSDISSSPANVLRVVPAMSSGANLTLTSGVTAISFNNLGGLAAPAAAVAISYVLGAQNRTLNVCLNGRIQLGGNCG